MRYIIDAFSWIAYLEGGPNGEKVNNILKSGSELFSLTITIAEVVNKIKRQNKNYETAYNAIISKSKIINPTPRIAKEAALLNADKRKKFPQFGIVDAILITTAKHMNAKVLIGDNHFKDFKETILI